MNPLAALLASLTGSAPGQAAATSKGETDTGMFAGLLAALGEGSGEAGLAGAPGAVLSLGKGGLNGTPESLLLNLDGEASLLTIAPRMDGSTTSTDTGVDEGLATGLGEDGAGQAGAQTQIATVSAGAGEAAGDIVEAGGVPSDANDEGTLAAGVDGDVKKTPLADADAASDEGDGLDAMPLLIAVPSPAPVPQAPQPAGPAAQETPVITAPATNPDLTAPGPVIPPAVGAPVTPPADGAAQGAAPGVATAATPSSAAASGPATAPAAPSEGAAPAGLAAQHNAPGATGESHDATTRNAANLVAHPDQTVEASTDMAPPEGGARSQPATGKSPLDILLQHTQQHHQGGEHAKASPVAGAADLTFAPQQARPAAPATTSLPPVPIAAVAVHIAQQIHAGAKRFEIRLDPPDLGRVEVRLDVTREGHATTHLVVERSETLDMLQRDARQLERALQNAGLNTSEGGLTFSLKDQGHAHDGAGDGEQPQGASDPQAGNETIEENWRPLPGGRLGNAGLDIRI